MVAGTWGLLAGPLAVCAALLLQGCGEDLTGDSGSPVAATAAATNSTTVASDIFEAHASEYTIPLNARKWGGGMRLAISVSPVAADGQVLAAQELLLDTGSSTLAFCDPRIASKIGKDAALDYMSCNLYNPGGVTTGYWGRFYKGVLDVQGGMQIQDGVFSVMTAEKSMPCTRGFQGIFGIAFEQLDMAFKYADLGPNMSKTACPKEPVADVMQPMMKELKSGSGVKQLGIHWSGNEGETEGTLYLERSATSNPHYSAGPLVGEASLGELGWYDISIAEIAISSASKSWVASDLDCSPTSTKKSCIMDTGTPVIALPKGVIALIEELAQQQVPLGSLTIKLQPAQAGASPVALEFDIAALVERQWIQASDGAGVILGLPLWASYYTVFDLEAKKAVFVLTGNRTLSPAASAPAKEDLPPSGGSAPGGAPAGAPGPGSASPPPAEISLRARAWGNGTYLTVSVSPAAKGGQALAAQELLLDTGSSTLALCDKSLANQVSASPTDYMSCNMYNPGGTPAGYWGRFYEGTVEVNGSLVIPKAWYSIMSAEENMPCSSGLDGIFGVAFKQLDLAFEYADLGPMANGTACPTDPVGVVVDPWMQELRRQGGPGTMGIYWSGALGDDVGRLYLDSAATLNPHYSLDSVVGQALLGEAGWFDVVVQEIVIGGGGAGSWAVSGFECEPVSTRRACVMDTGTPVLSVPKQVVRVIEDLVKQDLPLGSIAFELAGADPAIPVVLEFDIATLLENEWISEGEGQGVILGLPLWASYYTMIDIKEGVVTFVSTGESGQSSSVAQQAGGDARRLEGRAPVHV